MIITIDGPAGAGKSTVARLLAARLGFELLDTGAMYRAVGLAALRGGLRPDDAAGIAAMVRELSLERGSGICLNREDVTRSIRTPEVTQMASIVAEIPEVRERLVQIQREWARLGNFVCEGRDQGTVVFPDAACKFFLTASPEVRARRRWQELQEKGQTVSLDEVIAAQKIRDLRDETRAVGRLCHAADAIEVWTDGRSLDDVVDQLEAIARKALQAARR